jgi:hypothetical protein
MTGWERGLIIVASAAGLVIFWFLIFCGVSALASFIGGWDCLAEEYRVDLNKTATRIRLGYAWMRMGTHYNGVIGMDCQPNGLSLSVLWLFRFRHPPLFIPWDQIQYSESKSLFFFTKGTLILDREARIPLSFYNREARELVARYTAQRMPQSSENGRTNLPNHVDLNSDF